MAAVRHLSFVKFDFLTAMVKRPFCISIPNLLKIGKTVAEISRFLCFPDGRCRHLEFSKIQNFNGLSAIGANVRHHAKFHQNGSNGCNDMTLTVLKMAAVRHLGFVKFGAVKRPILHQSSKFRKDRLNRSGYIAIFVIFNMPPS